MTKKEMTETVRYKTFFANTKGVLGTSEKSRKPNIQSLYTASEEYDKERTISFVGTSEDVDRDNEIVLVDGWDFDNFKTNPVVLWMHDYRQVPIGKVVGITKDNKNKRIFFDIYFSKTYPFSETILGLVKEGILSATSVGFRVKDWDYDEDRDLFVLKENELFEISIVTVPANPKATVAQDGKEATEDKSKDSSDVSNLIAVVDALRTRLDELNQLIEENIPKQSEPSEPAEPVVEPESEPAEPVEPEKPVEEPKLDVTVESLEQTIRQIIAEVLASTNTQPEGEQHIESVVEPEVKPEEVTPVEPVVEVPASDVVPVEEPIEPVVVSVEELDELEQFIIINQ